MCNMSGIGGSTVQQAMLPASKGDVAGASGGGAVAGDMTSALAAINAALQQLVAAVQALTGNSALGGGAAKGGVEQLSSAPVQQYFPVQQSTTSTAAAKDEHAGHVTTTPSPSQKNLSASSKALLGDFTVSANGVSKTWASGKHTFERTEPEDRTKAAAILQKLMSSTAKYADPAVAQAAGYDFNKHAVEGDLVHVSKSTNQDLNLDDPGMLLYRKQSDGSLKLIGAVLGSYGSAPDLGIGEWHVHGDGNQNMMKHVWFTPNDLTTAYQESEPPASKF